MKSLIPRATLVASAIAVSTLVSGCATAFMGGTSDQTIQKNTATALGLDVSAITISNRENDGVKSTYLATTNSNKKYSCYVTSSSAGLLTGSTVTSDAICHEVAAGSGQSTTAAPAPSASCNALLKAAGQCS